MSSQGISRRDFLRATVGMGGAALLAACGSESPTAQENASGETGPTAPPAAAERIKIGCATWGMPFEAALYTDIYIPAYEEENPDIEVEFFDFERYVDDIVRLQAAGDIPDVVRYPGTQLQWAYASILTPLDELMAAANFDKEDFVQATWDGATFKGKIYAVSQSPNFGGLYFDKEAFDEAGLPYPDNDYTLDRMLADAKALTKVDGSGNVERYGLITDWGSSPLIMGSWAAAFGARVTNEDWTKATFDSDEMIEALTMMQTFVKEGIAPNNADRAGVPTMELFGQHKAAIFQQGTHVAPALTQNSPSLDFAATTMPKGTVKAAQAADVGFGIAELSKQKEKGFDFLAYMLNKPNLIEYWQTLWVAYPARKSTWHDPEFKKIKGIEDVITGLTGGDEEFQEKCQWQMDAYENQWVFIDWLNPLSAKMTPVLTEASDSLLLKEGAPGPEEVAVTANAKLQRIIDEEPI